MQKVIFACGHNAVAPRSLPRSLRSWPMRRRQWRSAGSRPGPHVHPDVRDAMREIGIDLSAAHPQLLTAELGRRHDACPDGLR